MPTTNLRNWDRFILLLWKNFNLLWDNWKQMVFLFMMPFIISMPVMVFRYNLDLEIKDKLAFQPIDLDKSWQILYNRIEVTRSKIQSKHPEFLHSVWVPQMKLGFAPNVLPAVGNILEEEFSKLDPILEVEGFSNCRLLEETMTKNHLFAGICFHSFDEWEDEYEDATNTLFVNTDILNFSVIFPSELRYFDEKYPFVGNNWKTHLYFDLNEANLRRTMDNDGGHVGYVREGFILLQQRVTEGFLKAFLVDVKPVQLQRLPHVAYLIDPMDNILLSTPLMTACNFLIPVLTFTYLITIEKERELKMFIRALGVPNIVILSVWYVVGLVLFFSNGVLILATLKLPFNRDDSVLPSSSPYCLLLLILTYCFATTGFCIFICSMFNECITAVSITGIAWILTFLPYISVNESWIYGICLNTALASAFETIRMYEIMGNGLQFEYIIDKSTMSLKQCGVIMLLFVLHGIVYLLLALIIEAILPKIIENFKAGNNFLMKPEKKRGDVSNRRVSSLVDPLSSRVAQVEPLYKKQLVSLEGVYKMYGKNEVVREVNLNLYENDVTVLLGHNGCGKTTLLSIILGIIPFTEGVVHIERYNLQAYKNLACSNVGGCLKTYLLYDDLTVENQIKFFSRLKGMTWKQCNMEVDKYCRQMQITELRKTTTRDLTVGMKQILAVCCAFAGDSKVVILDEPTSGMDWSALNLVAKLVESEKRNRTIFWSTNSIEIADYMADRVAVMAGGEIVCSGSISFLRNMYNNGRRLIITKGDGLKEEKVTALINQFIPGIQLDCNFVRLLVYTIHESYSHKISELLVAIEASLLSLSISSYTIEDVSIIEVVLNMGSDFPHDVDPKRKYRINHGETLYSPHSYPKIQIASKDLFFRRLQEFKALFNIRVLYQLKHKWLFLPQLIFPVLMTVIMFTYPDLSYQQNRLQAFNFNLDIYPKSVVIVGEGEALDEQMKTTKNEFKQMIFWMENAHKIKEVNSENFNKEVEQFQTDEHMLYERNCFVGADFKSDRIIAYFNNFPLHSAPLSMNLVYNAMARRGNEDTKVFVRLKPLPFDTKTIPLKAVVGGFYNYVLMLLLTSLITWSNSVYDMTRSTQEDFKHWLIISGVTVFDFWFVTFCFDLIRTVILVGAITFTILICLTTSVMNTPVLIVFFFVLLMGGIATFSVQYIFAILIKSEQTCFRTTLLFAVVGISLFLLSRELEIEKLDKADLIHYCFLIHPYYAYADALLQVFITHHYMTICDNKHVAYLVESNNMLKPDCKNISYLNHTGLIDNVYSFLLTIIVSWAMIIFLETCRNFRNTSIFAIPKDDSESAWEDHKLRHGPNGPSTIHEDKTVLEKIIVESMSAKESKNVLLTVDRLGKIYDLNEALHRFSFYVNKCNICGILGLNGAGKSVLLKILADKITQSYGEVKIFGESMLKNPRKMYSYIGYCPQNLDCILEYTPGEILEIFAHVKGIPPKKIVDYCENFAKLFGIYEYYDRVLLICSDGIAKRVGVAVALMGDPTLIYVDEPLSALDLHGKFLVFNMWSRYCATGRSVLFSSLNPSECQSFCNKIMMMIHGRLIQTGSMDDIYENYSLFFFIRIRLKGSHIIDTQAQSISNDNTITRIINLMHTSFENVVFRNVEGNLLKFYVSVDQNVGEIFLVLRNNAFTYNIESFSISRTPLESIYLRLVDRYKNVRPIKPFERRIKQSLD